MGVQHAARKRNPGKMAEILNLKTKTPLSRGFVFMPERDGLFRGYHVLLIRFAQADEV